jgi:hypothetical protein
LVATLVSLAAFAPQALAGAIIDNGTVKLGINDHGQLNFSNGEGSYFGVNYIPTGNDGTRAGCPCEGWGAGAGDGVSTPTFQGRADQAEGINGVALVSFTSTASTATSVVDVLDGSSAPAMRVTHEFKPSTTTPNLYDIQVTLKNLTASPLTGVRYLREMDWDIEPTPFDEFVTINRGTTPPADLIYSDDNGFADAFPYSSEGPLDSTTVNANYVDKGPADHGARFIFQFADLAPGAEKKFVLAYGAAGTETEANAAVSADGLEMFSYGQPNTTDGPTLGTPNTFIWGFKAVGGAPVIPPTLTLTPADATNPVGTSHEVTAELKDSSSNPIAGADILFSVSGANPQPITKKTTGADGKAKYSYTGVNTGDDVITACYDANQNGACERGEVTATAKKKWVAAGPKGRMVGEGRLTSGADKLDFAYVLDCDNSKNSPPKFQGKLNSSTFKVTSVTSVTCTDDPTKTPAEAANFDTQEGSGLGTLGTTSVKVTWKFVDGGPAGSGDSTKIEIRNASTDALLFSKTEAPPGPFGGGTRGGRNTATPPPSA